MNKNDTKELLENPPPPTTGRGPKEGGGGFLEIFLRLRRQTTEVLLWRGGFSLGDSLCPLSEKHTDVPACSKKIPFLASIFTTQGQMCQRTTHNSAEQVLFEKIALEKKFIWILSTRAWAQTGV